MSSLFIQTFNRQTHSSSHKAAQDRSVEVTGQVEKAGFFGEVKFVVRFRLGC